MGAETNDGLDPMAFTAELGIEDYRAMVASGGLSRLEGYQAPPGIVALPLAGNVDVPAEMRGMLGDQVTSLCATDLEVAEAELKQLSRQAGKWFASVLAVEGSVEVDVSFEGEDIFIVAIGENAPDFDEMDVDKLGKHGITVAHSTGDTFRMNRNRFLAEVGRYLNSRDFPAGC